MKKRKVIISLILLTTIVGSILNISFTSISINATEEIPSRNAAEQVDDKYQGLIIVADKLVANSKDATIVKNNTSYLQECIDTASNSGGGKVKIPAGTYYFASAGANARVNEEYVIKPKNNVTLEGAGIDEIDLNKCTILKPYGKVTLITQGGLDMFYFNDYRDYGTEAYLENADFINFIIDGEETEGKGYNSSGKGFMFLMVKDCDYENIIVRNTEATGFGMDCPINCTIKNCKAIDCGRAAVPTSVGASGFGIGTGYSNEESIYISNCTALGNKKFGIFFENQTRFCKNANIYPATESKGFVVSNCTASGNMYDFGGSRANDVTYENCTSYNSYANENVTNVAAFHFENMSRRIHMVNCISDQKFIDVSNSSKYYYEPVYWALNNAITEGVSKTKFNPKESATRAEAVTLLWRMAERPGEVAHFNGKLLNEQFENLYTDVSSTAYYIDAIKWAKEEGIIATSTKFLPNKACTRAQFITMLWRYAGKPVVTSKSNFSDVLPGTYYEDAVNWAASKGIIKGTTTTVFSPNKACTRADAVTFLYRYANTKNEFTIIYNLGGGVVKEANPNSYQAGKDTFTLNVPTKKGYTFEGWTGSNYSEYVTSSNYIPQITAQITTNDAGNKTYTANWSPNEYTVTFNSNGGNGTMEKEYFVYDDVPQALLKNKFTRAGYVFSGWNSKADGTGISFEDGEIVQNLTRKQDSNGVLYAQWTKTKDNGSRGLFNKRIIKIMPIIKKTYSY